MKSNALKRRLAVGVGTAMFVCIAWVAAAGATRDAANPVLRYGIAAAPDSLDPAVKAFQLAKQTAVVQRKPAPGRRCRASQVERGLS